jgi:hypothetical protein
MKYATLLAFTLLGLLGSAFAQNGLKPLRAGIVGLDTSHVPAFTKLFNKGETEGELAGIKVTTGYTGGTDMPASATRKEKFTQQLREMGVEIVDSDPEAARKGRCHPAGERRWPHSSPRSAGDLQSGQTGLHRQTARWNARRGHRHRGTGEEAQRAVFQQFVLALWRGDGRSQRRMRTSATCSARQTWGPCSYQEGTPDFFFYGIHGVEALYTLMGTGCETVSRVKAAIMMWPPVCGKMAASARIAAL